MNEGSDRYLTGSAGLVCVVLEAEDESLGCRRCALNGSRDENDEMHRKEVILPLHREYVES